MSATSRAEVGLLSPGVLNGGGKDHHPFARLSEFFNLADDMRVIRCCFSAHG
jgi:hypothetical protein